MAGQGPANSTEYITHHLSHLKVGEGFWTLHVDTIFMSVLTGFLALGLFYAAARKATSGVPGKGQAFVEMVVEFVDTQVKEVFHLDRRFLAPLALTIFLWVFFMNAMDLLPLDLPGKIAGLFGIHYWRAVPTADLNTTFAMLRHGAGASVQRVAWSFFSGWAVKVFFTVAMLVVALESPRVDAMPLLAGYVTTFVGYWFGASRWGEPKANEKMGVSD